MHAIILVLGTVVAVFSLSFFLWGRRTPASESSGYEKVQRSGKDLPDWLTLPHWPNGPTDFEISSQSRNILHKVSIDNNSCTCEKWVKTCRIFQANDLRRICKHIASAVLSHQHEYGAAWNSWTLKILESMSRGASHGVCARFEAATLSNGEEEFLAIYNCASGYTDLYGELGGFFGYLGNGNRWAWGEGPNHPLVLKSTLRPWIAKLDLKYRPFQEEYEENENERRTRDLTAATEKQTSENEAARFPLDLLPNAYRMQDFDRIHPTWIHFVEPVTVHVEVVSRTLTDETRRIVASIKELAPFEDEGDGFFHLKVDGKDLMLRFELGSQAVRVVFQRDLKRKLDYSHESFSPGECRWGREGTAPPRLLLVRGLVFDFLHRKALEGDRIDFELSKQPYMPDWEKFKSHPLDRAPYPPLP